MSLQTITVWGHWAGPNPFKVLIIIEALKLKYELKVVEFTEVKKEPYTQLNPNGRLPTIEDPNTGIILWETGAIIQYLIEQYDKESIISYTAFPEKYLTQQWLAFQISGQGPYVGQAVWFVRFHPDKTQSASDRFVNESFRIVGVLEEGLKRSGTGWLVGDKCTYADLSFVTWANVQEDLLKQVEKFDGFHKKYPLYTAWLGRMAERPEVATILAHIAKERAVHGLPP